MPQPYSSKTILLVEDEAIIAMGEKSLLEKHGYRVTTASSGEEAVQHALNSPVDLILMDIDLGMDKMDGTGAAEQILRERELPIVFLTSHAEREVVNKVKNITRYGYVLKNSGEFVLLESIVMAFELFDAYRGLKAEIEERRSAERKTKEYQNMLTGTFGAIDSLIAVMDRDLRVVLSNWKDHEWVPETEREKQPFCYEVMKNFDAPCTGCPTLRTFEDGKSRWYTDRNPVDGSFKEISVVPIRDVSENVRYVLENVRDITEQKLFEDKIRSQSRLLEAVDQAVIATDLRGNIVYLNRFAEELYGWDRAEALGRNILNTTVAKPSHEQGEDIMKALARGESWSGDFIARRKDGSEFWAHVKDSPLYDEEGKLAGIVGISSDITARKEAEKQKEVLFQELNHRVKNNLQMITSLIRLKESAPGNRRDVSDLIHQIDSIRLIHEKLYQAQALDSISSKDYFEELLTSIFSYSPFPVILENTMSDVTLDSKRTVPLGLVVNEIATNAVKHGFTAGKEARFSIGLSKDGEGNGYLLALSNTGRPFPENISLDKPESFGLQIVSVLVRQIGGTIELQRVPHTVFTIRFPE